jgi:hypothetical protein
MGSLSSKRNQTSKFSTYRPCLLELGPLLLFTPWSLTPVSETSLFEYRRQYKHINKLFESEDMYVYCVEVNVIGQTTEYRE